MLDQLDDAIRSALSDIAATAPSIDDVHFEPPVSGHARATWLLPAVAAAIVVLVVGLVAVGTRDRTAPAATETSTAPPTSTNAVSTTDVVVDGQRYPTVTARVTATPAGATVVTIDHGSSDGIQVGMAVASAEGLVGEVSAVSLETSAVRLVTDVAYAIECEVDGITAGCFGDGDSVSIAPVSGATLPGGGTGVVTTKGGPTSLAPPGVLVGRVDRTANDGASTLELAADLGHLSFVAVIRYVPSSAMPGTEPTVAVTEPEVPAPSLPPGVTEPATIAVLDPAPGGDVPLRDNPISAWLGMGNVQWPTRWFIQRDGDGTPIGGVRVTLETGADWATTFLDGTPLMLGDLEARMIGDNQLAQIAWPYEGGTILAAGLGSVEPDALVAIARDMAGLDAIDAIAVPAGLSEIEVPRPVSSVRYDTTEVALTVEQVDGPLDLEAIAMIRLGAWATPLAVPELGGYELGDGSGWQNLLVPIDADTFATISGPPGTDAKAMAATIHEVPTGEVAPQPVPKVGQGGDVPPRFGEISLGRFAAYEYTSDDGSECVTFVSLNLFASPSCLPTDRAQCPRFSTFDEGTIVVVLPYDADSVAVEVAGSGEAVPVTIEHALGYTFATGPSPGVASPLDVFVDGEPVCPSG